MSFIQGRVSCSCACARRALCGPVPRWSCRKGPAAGSAGANCAPGRVRMRFPPCSCPGTSRVHRPASSRLDTSLNKFIQSKSNGLKKKIWLRVRRPGRHNAKVQWRNQTNVRLLLFYAIVQFYAKLRLKLGSCARPSGTDIYKFQGISGKILIKINQSKENSSLKVFGGGPV